MRNKKNSASEKAKTLFKHEESNSNSNSSSSLIYVLNKWGPNHLWSFTLPSILHNPSIFMNYSFKYFPFAYKRRNIGIWIMKNKLQQPFNSLELSETRNTSCTFSLGLKNIFFKIFISSSCVCCKIKEFRDNQELAAACLPMVGGWHSAIRFLSLNSNTR